MKFKHLKVDLDGGTTYNCHAARPHPVDFVRLEQVPGDIFNIEINVSERQQMLANQRNSSCEQNCWVAEDNGAISPRVYQHGQEKTHTDIYTKPEIIDLTVGADCNLTCSYCCKEYSTAWRRDLVTNGDYNLSEQYQHRYSASTYDKLSLKVSQPEIRNSHKRQALLNEVWLLTPTLKKLTITGGEPLLDNKLLDNIEQCNLTDTVVEIYTGLGMSYSRFNNMLNKLSTIPNLIFVISAESIDSMLEFNRYGVKWTEFVSKIQLLEQRKIKFRFHSTLSCLTLPGFAEFYQHFVDHDIVVTFAYQPIMMAPYVLDTVSKQQITNDVSGLPEQVRNKIVQSISAEPTEQQRQDLAAFLKQFVSRRPDIDLNIYPRNFLEWLNI